MAGQRRKFTIDQKRYILDQADELGVNRILREHNISYSVFARWKHQTLTNGSDIEHDLLQSKMTDLQNENMRLKRIVANLVLDLEVKSEELKARK